MRTEPTTSEALRMTDEEARRLGRADRRAGIDWLYRAYAPAILTHLQLMLRGGEAARDLTQETFVRAYTHAGLFETVVAFRPWLLKVAYRLALNHVRESKRRQRRESRSEGSGPRDPLDVALENQVHQELRRGLATLPIHYRQVLVLKYHGGLSCEEIGRILEIAPGTVMSHLFRARLVLKRRLG